MLFFQIISFDLQIFIIIDIRQAHSSRPELDLVEDVILMISNESVENTKLEDDDSVRDHLLDVNMSDELVVDVLIQRQSDDDERDKSSKKSFDVLLIIAF
jgi:hypothetical protein